MQNCSPRKTRDTEWGLLGWGRGVWNSLTRLFSFQIKVVSCGFRIMMQSPGVLRDCMEPWLVCLLAVHVSGLKQKYKSAQEE